MHPTASTRGIDPFPILASDPLQHASRHSPGLYDTPDSSISISKAEMERQDREYDQSRYSTPLISSLPSADLTSNSNYSDPSSALVHTDSGVRLPEAGARAEVPPVYSRD